jgi:hypothetical protein
MGDIWDNYETNMNDFVNMYINKYKLLGDNDKNDLGCYFILDLRKKLEILLGVKIDNLIDIKRTMSVQTFRPFPFHVKVYFEHSYVYKNFDKMFCSKYLDRLSKNNFISQNHYFHYIFINIYFHGLSYI